MDTQTKNNQASITGRLGNIESDDFRYTTNEQTGATTAVFNLNIAVNPPKPEGTTRVPQAQWFDAVILGPLAEAMIDILQKGMLITLSGHTTQRSWVAQKDGQPVSYSDEKSGETKPAYQSSASLVVDKVCYTAADGLYYQCSEQNGEIVSAVVPAPEVRQKANIVLRGAASNIALTAATETSQARLNFTLIESYIKWSGAAGERRHRITMWGNQAVLAHAEMAEGDQVTVLGGFRPNSYTDQRGVYQQCFDITCRQLDNYGQKQTVKVAALQTAALAVATMPAPKARAPKARLALATA